MKRHAMTGGTPAGHLLTAPCSAPASHARAREPARRRLRAAAAPQLHGLVGAGEPRAGRQLGGDRRGGPALSDGRPEPLLRLRPARRFGGRDIWVSQRADVDAAWGAPVNLGPTINSPFERQRPGVLARRPLAVLRSDRPGGFGGIDIYQSCRPDVHDDFGWQAPANLGPNVNTASNDNGPATSRTRAAPRSSSSGATGRAASASADLYVSELQADGSWGPADAGSRSSAASSPTTRPDHAPRRAGDLLLLGSHRGLGRDRPVGRDASHGRRTLVDAGQPRPDREQQRLNDVHPYLSADGRTLFFGSNRPGGVGSVDLYMTTRAAKLTVTANDQSRLFGQANPPLTYAISGFVGGETSAVVSGTAACSTTATPSSPAGDYPITCTAGSLSAPGYVFDDVRRRHAHRRATRVRA